MLGVMRFFVAVAGCWSVVVMVLSFVEALKDWIAGDVR